jgi:flagellar assembly protein FliH
MSRILELREAHQIGIAPWMVETFDEPEAATEPAFLQRVDPTPTRPEAAPPPAIDVQQLLQEAAARSRQELEQAIQRTRQECEARAQARIEQEIEPWLRRMAQSIEDIATVKQRFLLDSEEQLVRLAVAIARRILYREIQIDGEALLGLIHAALQRSELREMQRILLNPKDHQDLQPHLARLQLPPRVEIIADNGLERGALLLESTTGVLDASIQSQLDEVERGFIDLLGRRN